jgi:uncharacterized protein YkwD
MMKAAHAARGLLIVFSALFICLTPGPAIESVRGSDDLFALEQDVLGEINLARTDPGIYLSYLKEFKQRYAGKQIRLAGHAVIHTKEGVRAVDEAYQYLRDRNPMPPLVWSKGMSQGAMDHVTEQGPAGTTGHRSVDGRQPWDRINRYGEWQGVIAENIAYGKLTARMMVLEFIIDDGIPDRGHRKNIFNPELRYAGVACGDHRTFGIMCVIDFAGGYVENGGNADH